MSVHCFRGLENKMVCSFPERSGLCKLWSIPDCQFIRNLRGKFSLLLITCIYTLCKAIAPLCKSATEVMFWFVMYMNESIKSTHHERVRFQGSNFVALFTFSDLELILFPLWYWPIMNAHTKQQQDKVFETDFIDSQKSDPPPPPPLCAPFGTKSYVF